MPRRMATGSGSVDYFRRLAPTPSALRSGRLTFAILAVVVAGCVALMVFLPGFADMAMLAVTASTSVTLAGLGVAYLGEPGLTRYRIGLVVATVGMLLSIYLWLADPFPASRPPA